MILKGKSVVLGITGGIAAYKAAVLCSQLVKAGAQVDVIMTEAAREFIAPLTFQALTHRPVVTEMFSLLAETEIGHVSLAKRADLMIVAPATANTIAKLATGMADNMLTSTALAARCPILLAPAMESQMWRNPMTQANLERLRQLCGVVLVGPGEGRLASGASGVGRMAEPDEILEAACWTLAQGGPLAGKRVVVTAGGTRESLDPIRFLGNRSSGKMGIALARVARDRGAEVTLISTVEGGIPYGMNLVPVETADQMHRAVMRALADADVLIMAAAVADYRPATTSKEKIKKGVEGRSLELIRTVDILEQVASQRLPAQVVVGFAAETERLLENARDKLFRKRLDLMVANDPREVMGQTTNQVTLISRVGEVEGLPSLPKEEVASIIMDRVVSLLSGSNKEETSGT